MKIQIEHLDAIIFKELVDVLQGFLPVYKPHLDALE